jgi:hypothetical protein
MKVEPPYAWPSPPGEMEKENQAAVLAEILKQSFEQSGTRIKDTEAIMSAARHIAQSSRLKVELKV